MSLIDELSKDKVWHEFLKYKLKDRFIPKQEQEYLKKYIKEKRYKEIVEKIINDNYRFSPPQKHLVQTIEKFERKAVYEYNKDETMVLKLLSYLLQSKYDNSFAPNCYSFRKDCGIKQAMENLTTISYIENLTAYHLTIEDYFNTIPVELLLPRLKEILIDDIKLYDFIKDILQDKRVIFEKQTLLEEKGIMAGTPISLFLANVYLNDIDQKLHKAKIISARYADELIIFCDENILKDLVVDLEKDLYKHQITVDDRKRTITEPGKEWNFLGFLYQNGIIDLSETTKKQIKEKIKKTSKDMRKWITNKRTTPEFALKITNRKFNKKFYELEKGKDFIWALWFFPIINTTNGLREIDSYMQSNLRYIVTGKHSKGNYKEVRYAYLKQFGYRALTTEYWKRYRNI